MNDVYEFKINNGGPWEAAPVAQTLECTFAEAREAAKKMAARAGREVRVNVAGSCQGHYWRPPVRLEVISL